MAARGSIGDRPLHFLARIGCADVAEAKNIVHTGAIKPREFDQHLGRNVVFPGLVFGITRLGHAQIVRHLGLVKIRVLPQIPQSMLHMITGSSIP